MRRLRGAFAIAVLLGALSAARPAASQVFLRADELLSRTLVNASRATEGAGPLAESPQLDAMARAQAVRMAVRGDIYHNPNLASDATTSGLHWLRIGENVGVGTDIPVMHAAFLATPHPRENLMFPQYTLMGRGVAPGTGDKTGLMFVAHVFAQVQGVAATHVPVRVAPRVVPAPARHVPVPAPVRTPAPTPAPTPVPTPTPNALVGGVVNEAIRI